jgi:hypothetical protein
MVTVAVALVADASWAQSAPADRGYLNAGVDFRVASANATGVERPIVFAEEAVVSTTYRMKTATGFDVGGGVRVWRYLGVGVDVSYVTKPADASIGAQVPHPLYLGRPRQVDGEAELNRHEAAVNVRLLWMIPVGAKWRVAIGGGPSWISVAQDLVQDVTVTQSYPYDTAAYAGPVAQPSSQSGVGFNAGADGTYLFSRHVGAEVSAIFARARVPSGTSGKSDAGGLHLGAGLRFVF